MGSLLKDPTTPAFVKDIRNLLFSFVDDGSVQFADFKKRWKALNFTAIHGSKSEDTNDKTYFQDLVSTALGYLIYVKSDTEVSDEELSKIRISLAPMNRNVVLDEVDISESTADVLNNGTAIASTSASAEQQQQQQQQHQQQDGEQQQHANTLSEVLALQCQSSTENIARNYLIDRQQRRSQPKRIVHWTTQSLVPIQIRIRIASVFIAYCLYQTQPYNPKYKINVSIEIYRELQTLQQEVLYYSEECVDIYHILFALREWKALCFSAYVKVEQRFSSIEMQEVTQDTEIPAEIENANTLEDATDFDDITEAAQLYDATKQLPLNSSGFLSLSSSLNIANSTLGLDIEMLLTQHEAGQQARLQAFIRDLQTNAVSEQPKKRRTVRKPTPGSAPRQRRARKQPKEIPLLDRISQTLLANNPSTLAAGKPQDVAMSDVTDEQDPNVPRVQIVTSASNNGKGKSKMGAQLQPIELSEEDDFEAQSDDEFGEQSESNPMRRSVSATDEDLARAYEHAVASTSNGSIPENMVSALLQQQQQIEATDEMDSDEEAEEFGRMLAQALSEDAAGSEAADASGFALPTATPATNRKRKATSATANSNGSEESAASAAKRRKRSGSGAVGAAATTAQELDSVVTAFLTNGKLPPVSSSTAAATVVTETAATTTSDTAATELEASDGTNAAKGKQKAKATAAKSKKSTTTSTSTKKAPKKRAKKADSGTDGESDQLTGDESEAPASAKKKKSKVATTKTANKKTTAKERVTKTTKKKQSTAADDSETSTKTKAKRKSSSKSTATLNDTESTNENSAQSATTSKRVRSSAAANKKSPKSSAKSASESEQPIITPARRSQRASAMKQKTSVSDVSSDERDDDDDTIDTDDDDGAMLSPSSSEVESPSDYEDTISRKSARKRKPIKKSTKSKTTKQIPKSNTATDIVTETTSVENENGPIASTDALVPPADSIITESQSEQTVTTDAL